MTHTFNAFHSVLSVICLPYNSIPEREVMTPDKQGRDVLRAQTE